MSKERMGERSRRVRKGWRRGKCMGEGRGEEAKVEREGGRDREDGERRRRVRRDWRRGRSNGEGKGKKGKGRRMGKRGKERIIKAGIY